MRPPGNLYLSRFSKFKANDAGCPRKKELHVVFMNNIVKDMDKDLSFHQNLYLDLKCFSSSTEAIIFQYS